MSGKNGSRQVIEAILAGLARVSLPAPLAIVMAVADHCCTTAVKADNAVRPSELTNDVIALRFVEQVRQRDQVHHGFRSLPQRERPTDQRPNQNQHVELLPRTGSSIPCRGLFITPKPDKSLSFKDGLAEGWAFDVTTAFRKQLDIEWQQYVDKERTKELRRKNPGLRWAGDKPPTVPRMAWSRGTPPLLSFEVGDVVYDPPGTRSMVWGDALKVLRRAVQVKDAQPDTEPGAGGWVKGSCRVSG
jgi:hypothetical protein